MLLTSYDYHGLPLFMTLSLSLLFVHNLADSALGLSQAPKLPMLTSAHRNGAGITCCAVLELINTGVAEASLDHPVRKCQSSGVRASCF